MGKSYIGLSTTWHDPAIAIVNEQGNVVFAEATERYAQSKRGLNLFPDQLYHTGELISEFCPAQDDLVLAFSWSRQREKDTQRFLESVDEMERSLDLHEATTSTLKRITQGRFVLQSTLAMDRMAGRAIDFELGRIGQLRNRQVARRYYSHHHTHAAAASFTSPFQDALCAVIDGAGEDGACAFYSYENGRFHEISQAPSGELRPYGSLGLFYALVCRTCGFDSIKGEEWKVMGLAPYGQCDDALYARLRELLVLDGLNLWTVDKQREYFIFETLHRIERKHRGRPLEAADVAFTGQKVFEDVLYEMLRSLHQSGTSRNLVLSGGCALNSAANGGILRNTPFDALYVPSAPGDDGNAIGAALLAHREDHPDHRPSREFQSPYLGASMSAETLGHARRFGGYPSVVNCGPDAPRRAAEMLANGAIIGWIQGRAEFGARALGNRSILADPRSMTIKEDINARVKFREQFRPFAPSILHEFGPEYFEDYQETPYMERTLKFRHEVMDRVPGVVHQDGTGRLQTVKREWNAPFYDLIRWFYQLTGVPMVLNTSYNVMGKPIAHTVEDALAVFGTSGIDALFIDGVMIEKVRLDRACAS